MNFSDWSIRRPIPSILLFAVLMIFGLFGFYRMKIEEMPSIKLPAAIVVVALAGAAAPQVEAEITQKIESSMASVNGVKHLYSTISHGVSQTTIEFDIDKDMREAMEAIRNAVAGVRGSLPGEASDPFVDRVQATGGPILTYAIDAAGMDAADLSWFVDDVVGKSMLGASGVGSVTRHGGAFREVRIELDARQLQSLNITPVQVSEQIVSVQRDLSGGSAHLGTAEQSLHSTGMVNSLADLKRLPLTLGPTQRPVPLGEIGSVRDTIAEPRSLAVLDGKTVVRVQVKKANGASDIDVVREVRAVVKTLEAKYPGIRFSEFSSTVGFIEEQYKGGMRAFYEGALLTVLVVWLFLRDFRATAISVVALPLSIVPTFFVMYLLGYTLNTVTLLALTLSVGVLVDDAIVEVENIVCHLGMGKTPMQAVRDAVNEIGLAVIATSFALVAVFLPTAFMGGISGKIFQQFGGTAAVAIIASLMVARLLTPMLAAYYCKPVIAKAPTKYPQSAPGRLMAQYLSTVGWCTAHSGKTCGGAAIFFALSIWLAASLPFEFMPPDNSNEITVEVTAPPGMRIDQTAAIIEAARTAVMQVPEVKSVFASIGSDALLNGNNSGQGGTVDTGTMLLKLHATRTRTRQQVEGAVRERVAHIAGARFAIGGGNSGDKYSLALTGNDTALLHVTALSIAREMRALPGFGNVSTSIDLLRPQIVIHRNPLNASDSGVSTLEISRVLRVATGAESVESLSKLNLPSRQIPIRVMLDERSRNDLESLSQLRIMARGKTVPLSSVASLELGDEPSRLTRRDRMRVVMIELELNGRSLSEAAKLVDTLASLMHLPAGMARVATGDLAAQQELVLNVGIVILSSILFVYIILVLLFNDFLQPLTILTALPLAAGGSFAALWALDFSVSLPAMIGVIMLIGIVSKNSILLVDYATMAQRDHGLTRQDAVIDACRKRARPIIMTTVAMVAGMLPLVIGLAGDPGFRAPMAVVVIGGLLSSTLLSLLVVPVAYTIVDKFQVRIGRSFGKDRREPGDVIRTQPNTT